jgi:hypothetical protein
VICAVVVNLSAIEDKADATEPKLQKKENIKNARDVHVFIKLLTWWPNFACLV